MKVEQIFYTRLGGSELGAGWQTRKSEHFDPEAEKGCIFQFNCIVDSALDKSKKSPEYIYAMWHSNGKIFSARSKKIDDQYGRGNILAQAYAVNENEYISVLSKPSKYVCINSFEDNVSETPEVLEDLPSSEVVTLRDICHRYGITSEKMQTIVSLILAIVFRRSSQAAAQRRALKIIVDCSDDELCRASREIMTAVYSFMPCMLRLNVSYASYAHEKLEGFTVLFTNKPCDNYCYDINTGERKFPEELIAGTEEPARVFIENRTNADFQRDIEDYVLHSGQVYNLGRDGIIAAYLYSSIKNGVTFSIGENDLFKALAVALKDTRSGIQDDYIAGLVMYYIDSGKKVSSTHADLLVTRYGKTKNENLKRAVDYYNYSFYAGDYNDKNFSKFCSLQRTAPEIYENTLRIAIEKDKKEFLSKVSRDIARSSDTMAAFENCVSNLTKRDMYSYMIKRIYLDEDGHGYSEFDTLRGRVPKLYTELLNGALRDDIDLLKKYYYDYFIDNAADNFDLLAGVKEFLGRSFDKKLAEKTIEKAGIIFKGMCVEECLPSKFKKYIDLLKYIINDYDVLANYEQEAKMTFWSEFKLEKWRSDESYASLSIQSNDICKITWRLESIANRLNSSIMGDAVYGVIIKEIIEGNSYSSKEKTAIVSQLQKATNNKRTGSNIDDIVLRAINIDSMKVDLRDLERQLKVCNPASIAFGSSPMLEYAVRYGADRRGVINLYERLLESCSDNKRLIEIYRNACIRSGIPLKMIEREVSRRSRTDIVLASSGVTIVAIAAGAALSSLMQCIGGDGPIWMVIKILTVIICTAAIALPCIMVLRRNKDFSILTALSTVIYTAALTVFGYSLMIPAGAVAVAVFILSFII